jgi:hypothetical protein
MPIKETYLASYSHTSLAVPTLNLTQTWYLPLHPPQMLPYANVSHSTLESMGCLLPLELVYHVRVRVTFIKSAPFSSCIFAASKLEGQQMKHGSCQLVALDSRLPLFLLQRWIPKGGVRDESFKYYTNLSVHIFYVFILRLHTTCQCFLHLILLSCWHWGSRPASSTF